MQGIYRADILRMELPKLGYLYTQLTIENSAYTKFVSPQGRVWMYRDDRGYMPFPYISSVYLTYDKAASAKLVRDNGFHTIQNIRYNGETAAQLRVRLGIGESDPLVIKPADSNASRGVTLNVRTDSDVNMAVDAAKKHSQKVMVEPYVRGEEIRFGIIDGRVSMVVHKMKPQVKGDGHRTLRQLIDDLNRRRNGWKLPYVKYPEIEPSRIDATVRDRLDKVVARGETVLLCDSVAIEDGASFHDRTTTVHESYNKLAVDMASLFGRGYLAIDLLIEDYTQPAGRDNYTFLEVNDLPGMQLFCQASATEEVAAGRDLAIYIDKVLHV